MPTIGQVVMTAEEPPVSPSAHPALIGAYGASRIF
jgi:hypothetical protein